MISFPVLFYFCVFFIWLLWCWEFISISFISNIHLVLSLWELQMSVGSFSVIAVNCLTPHLHISLVLESLITAAWGLRKTCPTCAHTHTCALEHNHMHISQNKYINHNHKYSHLSVFPRHCSTLLIMCFIFGYK